MDTATLLARRRVPLPAIGDKFGRLTVLGNFDFIPERAPNRVNPSYRPTCECRCECGTVKRYRVKELRQGKTRSCTCLQRDSTKTSGVKRRIDPARLKLHRVYTAMVGRCCHQQNAAFPAYGGRGITVCAQWLLSKEHFDTWALGAGYSPELTLDRIDNDGPYSPENCRWTNYLTQNRNRRDNILLTAFGETKCLSEWLTDNRCLPSRHGIRYRLSIGMDAETAMRTPPNPLKNRYRHRAAT